MSEFAANSSVWARWWYAAKPASWPKLLVPSIFGQALGIAAIGASPLLVVSWGAVVFGAAFTMCYLLALVFLNDWGDREVDAIKRRMFADGCSPKTIPDGILPASAVRAAGLAALVAAVATAALGSVLLDRPHLGTLGLVAALSIQVYTFGPVRLNYRGGGELVEMIGVGAILPLIHAYAQSGMLSHPAYSACGGFVLLSLASALASGLSDEVSDRAGGKRTFTTIFGNRRVRQLTELCVLTGILVWLATGILVPQVQVIAAAAASGVGIWHGVALRRASSAAVMNAFAAQGLYKHHLHRAIWHGATVFAVLQLVCFDLD